MRKDYTQVFDKLNNPVLLRDQLERNVIFMLEGKARDGAAVMLYRPGLLDKEVDMHALMAYSVMSIEKLLEEEQVQICGLRSLEDMEGFNLSSLFKISLSELAKMNSIWVDAMPIRFRAAHLLNEGRVYDAIMKLMRPFMSKKMLDRVKCHGRDMDSVHEFIEKRWLPPYLNGDGATCEAMGEKWREILSEDWPKDTEL